jgi:RNase H-like domain found in reverse transcriptase
VIRAVYKYLKGYNETKKMPRNRKRKTTVLSTNEQEKFEWTSEAQTAFETLKTHLVSAPVLKAPEFDSEFPFEISSDASNFCIGGVLEQRNRDGKLQPIGL